MNTKETASKLLIKKVPTVNVSSSVWQAQQYLFDNIRKFESIHYIYVVDKGNHLKGILSVHELLKHKGKVKISRIMRKKVFFARPGTDQERVAHLALKKDIVGVPIVNKYGVLVGSVPSEALLKVMYKESREDLLKIAGAHHEQGVNDDIMKISPFKSLKHRLPWLIFGLLGGLFAAQIVGFYEVTLAKHVILAAFIPLVVYMGGAVEAQMVAFIIRDYAINPDLKFTKYFLKQFVVVIMLSVLISLALFVFANIFYSNMQIALVTAIALCIAIISSVTTGLVIPFIFTRFKQDPANASGPVATIIQDILSVIIYFSVATILL
ncbi:magnesium transporter [Candidatus Peregrinibacteria bacterium]|nr:magnesium transporter [Candidatus Peregrinibacteria bacterium]